MTTTSYIIYAWVIVCSIGYYRIKTMYRSIIARIDFLDEYRVKFKEFANHYFQNGNLRFVDQDLYEWLTIHSVRVQLEVGDFGVAEIIGPPDAYRKRDYQFIINTLPKFRKNMVNDLMLNHLDGEAKDIEDILLRRHGFFLERKENIAKELKNPFKWLQFGIKFFIALPFHLLKWFGIISDNSFGRINENKLIEWISGIITLIGFLGSIVTIFTGWEAFKKIIQNWLK